MTLHSNLILAYFTCSHSMVNDGSELLFIDIVTCATYTEKFPDVDYVIFINDYVYRKMTMKSRVSHILLDVIHVLKKFGLQSTSFTVFNIVLILTYNTT